MCGLSHYIRNSAAWTILLSPGLSASHQSRLILYRWQPGTGQPISSSHPNLVELVLVTALLVPSDMILKTAPSRTAYLHCPTYRDSSADELHQAFVALRLCSAKLLTISVFGQVILSQRSLPQGIVADRILLR